jgi:hypothetical protein
MTSRDFCYWLQGFMELREGGPISSAQADMIRRHLALVFIHEIDPSFPAAQQEALSEAHAPPLPTSPEEAKPTKKKHPIETLKGSKASQPIIGGVSPDEQTLYRC